MLRTHDDLNRLDLIEHWNGMTLVDSIDYTYNAVGFRTQMVDSIGTTTYTPDALDRIASVTLPGSNTVSYTYDDAPGGSVADYPGQRTKITYPDGKYVDYTYLADGRMSTVKDWLNRQTAYTYGDSGRLDRADYPNGLWTLHGYDSADRLTSVVNRDSAAIRSSFTYTLDAVGNRTQDVDNVGTTTYQYDPLSRITQESNWDPSTMSYTYDANGNRSTKGNTSYTYDAADQMVSAGGVSYGYDANGNQTGRGTDSFTYDHENRLTQSVIGGVTSSSTYNGDGLRMSHTVSGQTTGYTWDVGSSLPVVLKDNTYTYVYGLDLIAATDAGGNQNYYMYNGLGSVTNIVDYSGAEKALYFYDAFGNPRYSVEFTSNVWKYTAEQRDADSGFYYLRARYYDPAIGRFVSQDPADAGHPYAYVENNPVNFVDPSGLFGCGPFSGVCDAVSGGYNCVRNPVDCAVDEFVGSSLDKKLVGQAGAAAKALAGSRSEFVNKEGGINLIQNCGSAFCKALFAATQTENCVTIGNTILCKSTCPVGFSCFRHEATHVRQYRDLGLLGFYEEYFESDPKNALKCLASGEFAGLFDCVYRNRPLEREASAND